jgi:hypothetical protein
MRRLVVALAVVFSCAIGAGAYAYLDTMIERTEQRTPSA